MNYKVDKEWQEEANAIWYTQYSNNIVPGTKAFYYSWPITELNRMLSICIKVMEYKSLHQIIFGHYRANFFPLTFDLSWWNFLGGSR